MPEVVAQPAPLMELPEGHEISADNILSIDLIRTHTKTDDVVGVTDEQLRLYRKSSLEAAEQYSGLLINNTVRLTEEVSLPRDILYYVGRPKKHTLRYQLADRRVMIRGMAGNYMREFDIGTREIYIDPQLPSIDFSCRNGPNGYNKTTITYIAGFAKIDDIPGGIVLGCLKYIAWCVANPGDVLMTVRNTQKSNNATIIGTNNIPWSSGALELWRQYAREEY
jgi:hypothetical protein